MKVVYSAHQFSVKENIGDVLSAKAIAILYGDNSAELCCLPSHVGESSCEEVIYGGGGMIRPYFAEREIFADFRKRSFQKRYIICGVGLNRDEMVRDFSFDDMCAILEWVKRSQITIVRDRHTERFFKDCLGYHRVKVAPCPTYIILHTSPTPRFDREYELGIVPSFGHTASYYQFLPQIEIFVLELVEIVGPERVSIICHDFNDYNYATKLFHGKSLDISLPRSFQQVKRCYSRCKKIVSVRGHGLIFASACGKPCSVVSLNLKMSTLFEFHYGERPLGLDFNARSHLLFLQENILPLVLELPSNGELF